MSTTKEHKQRNSKKNRSSLDQHKKVGKTLVTPMMQIQNLTPLSWVNHRLPDLLWACLVISTLPRLDALAIFRKIAALGFKYKNQVEHTLQWDLTHTGLTFLPDDIFLSLINLITKHPLGYAALRPLLLIESLPGIDRWKTALAMENQQADWETLSSAIANTLNHQSQEATDVRWLTILFKIALRQITIAPTMADRFTEIINYPNQGDMRSVRPSIRSIEMAFRTSDANIIWCDSFWLECLKKTECIPGIMAAPKETSDDVNITLRSLYETQYSLFCHWFATITTTAVDARHDAVFGFGFYALALYLELLIGRNRQGLIGRLILKTLTECRISLAYLIAQDSPELWLKYRNFGAGQAKLALLKIEEIDGEKPSFISEEILDQIANEDMYQEYLNIELGHWCGLDLRKMAEATGTKGDYDKYYSWTSTYSHSQWPAMRDACFTTCFNPLHRLHRVPLLSHRVMENTIPDAISLVNKILSGINSVFSGFSARL